MDFCGQPHFWTNSTLSHCHCYIISQNKKIPQFQHLCNKETLCHTYSGYETVWIGTDWLKRLWKERILSLTHCDTENWIVMLVGMYPDVQKLNVYPVLSVFHRNPRSHYFCILKVMVVGSFRRNLVTSARWWDLVRLYLPPPSSFVFKAH